MDCEVINDLIPLYKEGICSNESKKLVEDHIKTCERCRSYFLSLDDNEISNNEPLEFISLSIDKNKKNRSRMIGSLIFSLLLIVFSFLTNPRQVEYDKDLIKKSTTDDKIIYEFRDDVTRIYTDYANGEYGNTLYIDGSYSYLDRILGGEKQVLTLDKKDYNVILYNNNGNKAAKVLYDPNGYTMNSGSLSLPRLIFAFYAKIALCLFVLGLILSFTIFRKWDKFKKIRLVSLPLSYVIATFLIKGYDLASFHPVRDLGFILITSLAIYLFIYSTSLYFEEKEKYKI
ncbi:zf-HC2 domain-containing protein [Anaerococcus provencensis]|uniref:zf-HC2 domain-containing protein n=1 Tax=Anaerococcus provencensis TaxID=938293 RepID=UPI00031D6438|nr:zf-HC2 domain-containing protein [Anaerococcus provencensis]